MPARPAKLTATLLAFAALGAAAASAGTPTRVTDVRLWSGPEGTRLVIELSAPTGVNVFSVDNPDRIVIDLDNAEFAARKPLPDGQGPVKAVRAGPQAGGALRLVMDLDAAHAMRSFSVGPDGATGPRLVVELPAPASTAAPARAAAPGSTEVLAAGASAIAAKPVDAAPVKRLAGADANGRDIVVAVDAGHGGQDPGALGRNGTREKDVTLAIAKKLAAAINAEPGMRAVLIRDGDYFITLGGRTRKARELGADIFVSVHADSVRNRDVSGSSVYVLSLRGASDEAARWLAESENAADLKGGVSLDDKDDALASVLLDVTQKESISNSVDAADSVLASLRRVVTVHRQRVQHAGFVVLKSPDIPSMLVETAFISNAGDERRLRDPQTQQQIAEAIRDGVRGYFYERPPPGTKVAAIVERQRGGGGGNAQTLAER
ncbi:MAG: N-acetylmuramoyl-L-alanine amidase [Steroidobacteraceae bacterium]